MQRPLVAGHIAGAGAMHATATVVAIHANMIIDSRSFLFDLFIAVSFSVFGEWFINF